MAEKWLCPSCLPVYRAAMSYRVSSAPKTSFDGLKTAFCYCRCHIIKLSDIFFYYTHTRTLLPDCLNASKYIQLISFYPGHINSQFIFTILVCYFTCCSFLPNGYTMTHSAILFPFSLHFAQLNKLSPQASISQAPLPAPCKAQLTYSRLHPDLTTPLQWVTAEGKVLVLFFFTFEYVCMPLFYKMH